MDQLLVYLTRELIGGFNVLSVIGFSMMGIGLALSRQGRSRAPIAFVLMGIGTAIVFVGLFLAPPSH